MEALLCLIAAGADIGLFTNLNLGFSFYRCLIRLYLTICDGLEENEELDNCEINKNGVEPMDVDVKINLPTKNRASMMKAAIESVEKAHQVCWIL